MRFVPGLGSPFPPTGLDLGSLWICHLVKENTYFINTENLTNLILELQKGARHPHYNFDFINKIKVKI